MKLPTSLPGISFTGRGYVWFRHSPTTPAHERVPRRAARAAALAATYERASSETASYPPDNPFEAEQKASFLLADWQPTPESNWLEFRAQIQLEILADDANRAEKFATARRAARLDQELVKDHIDFLRDVILQDDKTAALWWLQRNLAGPEPAISWADFDRAVLPLVSRKNQTSDPADRFAETMVDLVKRIHERPELLDTLAAAGTLALNFVNETELADKIARQASQSRKPGNNGASPLTGESV